MMKLYLILFAAFAVGCSNPPPSGLPITPMQIGSKTYQLEIAGDDASREHGLMERDSMPADHGMIFVFAEPAIQNFWMRHTRFPLDIIYVDDHAVVVTIDSMKSYDETTPHRSTAAAKYAIELSLGEATSDGVKQGDKLQIPAIVNSSLTR